MPCYVRIRLQLTIHVQVFDDDAVLCGVEHDMNKKSKDLLRSISEDAASLAASPAGRSKAQTINDLDSSRSSVV